MIAKAVSFTAAQAAEKPANTIKSYFLQFTAAQAAEKWKSFVVCVSFSFTAAQAAEKPAKTEESHTDNVHCRTGS